MPAFKQAADQKDESTPGKYLVNITMKFFSVYEMFDAEKYHNYLEYEIKNI